ncbi:MAG: DUF2892 domain-containing protein [Bacteroidales bacterium]|jgi:hypothetical protein|nr:DUF2892 domain-containing protein [Bacteroidales bacterium]
MKKNMGIVDKIIRSLIALIVMVLFYFKVISGTLGVVLLVIAGVFLLTSFVSFCPLYKIFGFNTCPATKAE